MANELTLSISASETKNGVTFAKNFSGLQITVTGNTPISNIQAIGTTDETLALGDVVTMGYFVAKNIDGTNYVQLGITTGTYFGTLKKGEACVLRMDGSVTAIHAKANTASINLEYLLLPD